MRPRPPMPRGRLTRLPTTRQPFMFSPFRPQSGSRGGPGGLLSRLFQRTNASSTPANAFSGFERASQSGSFLQRLTSNPQSINGFLSNTQQILKTAQQIGPMVQQYGPMVRNLPAMWKLYRGLKNATEETASESSNTNETSDDENKKTNLDLTEEEITSTPSQEVKEKSQQKKNSTPKKRSEEKGKSLPKLYI
jgi:YqfQ-like protein